MAETYERLREYSLTSKVAELCISIRQKYRVKLPDAIIAATALYLSLPLMTRNVKDFSLIPDLKLINPFEVSEDMKDK
jgi:predicted nucleic acid-binding protein